SGAPGRRGLPGGLRGAGGYPLIPCSSSPSARPPYPRRPADRSGSPRRGPPRDASGQGGGPAGPVPEPHPGHRHRRRPGAPARPRVRRQARWAGLLARFQTPTQVIATGFGAAALLGTLLLSLPIATASGEPTGWITALFTATSAVSLTGLTIVDTERHWSLFGELVIILLAQIGGLGIMTLATLFTVIVSGRIGLRARMFAAAETKALSISDVRHVVRNVALFSLIGEAAVAAVLTARFVTGYGEPFGQALYL